MPNESKKLSKDLFALKLKLENFCKTYHLSGAAKIKF